VGEDLSTGYFAGARGTLAVIVLHEAYGLFSPSSNVPAFCDRLAGAGFSALAPDLYRGATATAVDQALELMRALDPKDAVHQVSASMAHLRDLGAPRVAVLGFCMGGGLSFQSALEVEGLSGAIMFYATPRGEFHRLHIPVLGHFSLHDAFVSVDAVHDAERDLLHKGKRVTFHYYDADHSFMNERLPAFSRTAAALAWDRTWNSFVRSHA
jgi:carboxymethylenebutenolidase